MRAARQKLRRAGFTLIEMVVVIGIIVILLAIGAAFLPGLQGNQKVQNGVDRVAQWLLIAKNRAKHDGLPTGLRFIIDPNNPTQVSQFVYVQQPDALFGDATANTSCFTPPTSPGSNTYGPSTTLYFNGGPDFTGADANNPTVQNFDYLELYGGGTLYQINSNVPSSAAPTAPPTGNSTSGTTLSLSTLYTGPTVATPTISWRIIRQPRRVPGEDILTLPQDVVVDVGTIPSTTSTWSQNVPIRAGGYEILFSPSGDVIGQTAISGKILLWVRDATVPSPSQGDVPTIQGNPTLIAISARGGFLGTYPVLPNTDPTSPNYPNQFYAAAVQGRSGF